MADGSPTNDPIFAIYNSNPSGLLVVLLVGFIVPVVVVALRFAARKIERVSWWWDDYVAFLSLLLFVGGFWADLEILRWNSADAEAYLVRVYIGAVLYPLVVSTTKISGLLLYVLHFGYDRRPKRFAYALMILVVGWGAATFLATVLQCQPVQATWSSEASNAHCLDRALLFRATAIAEACINLLILILPLPKIWQLDLRSPPQIIALIQVYLLGSFVLVCASLRAYYCPYFQPFPNLSPSPMSTFTPLFLYTKLSESFGLQTICAPTILPALTALFTCSIEEPKERARREAQRKVQKTIAGAGYGDLLTPRSSTRSETGERQEKRHWRVGRTAFERIHSITSTSKPQPPTSQISQSQPRNGATTTTTAPPKTQSPSIRQLREQLDNQIAVKQQALQQKPSPPLAAAVIREPGRSEKPTTSPTQTPRFESIRVDSETIPMRAWTHTRSPSSPYFADCTADAAVAVAAEGLAEV